MVSLGRAERKNENYKDTNKTCTVLSATQSLQLMRKSVVTLKMTASLSLYTYLTHINTATGCTGCLYCPSLYFLILFSCDVQSCIKKQMRHKCMFLAPCRKILVGHICIKNVAMLNKQMVHKSSSLMMT